MTEAQLARAAGISQSAVSRIEAGLREPSAGTLRGLAVALNVSADYLLGLEPGPDRQSEPGKQARSGVRAPKGEQEVIREGSHTPWGAAQDVEELGAGVTVVHTASHGGVHMTTAAAAEVPTAVRRTLMNGAQWAEEDCEASIVLAILEAKGLVDKDAIGISIDRLRKAARSTAETYDEYKPALAHLPPVSGQEQQPTGRLIQETPA